MMCPICTSWSSALNTNHVFKVSRCLLLHCLWNVRLIFSRSGGKSFVLKTHVISPLQKLRMYGFFFWPVLIFILQDCFGANCPVWEISAVSWDVCLLLFNIMEPDGSRFTVLRVPKNKKNKTNKEKDASEKRRRKSRNSFSYFWVGGEICGHESWSEYSKILLWAVSSGALTAWAS